jgi:phosphatidylinositol phosphate synthase
MEGRPAISTHLEKLKVPPDRARRGRYGAGRALLDPAVRGLVRIGATPNGLTVIGLLGAIAAAVLVLNRHWIAAGLLGIVISLLDICDGGVARATGRSTRFGAFLDSTFDRLADALYIGAIGVTFAQDHQYYAVGAAFLALAGSFLVSYTRARAEGLGVDSSVVRGGLMDRPARLTLLAIGIFLAPVGRVLEVVMVLLAVLTMITVAQRMWRVHQVLADEPSPGPPPPDQEQRTS